MMVKMENTPTASQIPKRNNITAFAVPSEENSSKLWNSKAPIVAQQSISLYMKVVGDKDANHVFIRVRHRSRTSPWVPFSLCVAHGNAEFLQTVFGLVLRLVGLILISVRLCLLHRLINFGLRQLPFSPRYPGFPWDRRTPPRLSV